MVIRLVVLILVMICSNNSYGQQPSFVEKKDYDTEIRKINDNFAHIKKTDTEIKATLNGQSKKIDSLSKLIETKTNILQKNVDATKEESQTQVLSIDRKMTVRTSVWIAVSLCILLTCILFYILIRKKILVTSQSLDDQIAKTRENLEEKGLKLDNKLMEVLESQLKLQKIQAPHRQEEVDHSLALKVGEEIHRMRKRIDNMPEDIKGLGALKNSLVRLEEEFNNSGYEIINLVGRPWNDGLTVEARFVPSDDLKPGESIVTKVIRPQINYKGILIKVAEIEVSTGG